MRIGFDAKRAFFNRSGLGNYSRHTISILSQFASDNEYFLYTPKISNAIAFDKPSNVFVKSPGNLNRIFNRSWRTHRIIKDFKRDKIDLFHGLSNELPFTIKKSWISSIVTIHDLIFLRYPEFYYGHDREIYKSKFLKSCINADKIIAISEQTKRDIIEFFNIDDSKIEVVYQGCDPIFSNAISDNKLNDIKNKYNLPEEFILNVGTIEKRKNIFNVIKAIKKGNIDIPLVVVGKKTTYFKEIMSYIEKHNLQTKVLFYQDISFEDLPVFYRLSSLFIYPSLFEGFGIPILEALNSGTPVITNQDGCFKEAGGPDSFYLNPTNTEQITSAINTVLSDRELRTQMIDKGFEFANNFSEEKIAKNLINAYNTVK